MGDHCPRWLLIGSSPEPHDCHLTKGHEGPRRCRCDIEWEGQ